MGKLFGTDGIRGVANEYPIIPELAVNIGKIVASVFKDGSRRPKIVIGKDTRASGDMLEYALASGICSAGADAYLAGVLPTPGVAFLTSSGQANAGMMISASHNPFFDNGIKIFQADGYKLPDEKEAEIERCVLEGKKPGLFNEPIRDVGRVHKIADASNRYLSFLKTRIEEPDPFNGLKIVLDCSNGATYKVGPRLFSDLGADVFEIFARPNGSNINDGCGSEHPEMLQKKVLEIGADIGLAFDGDGDRMIAVDEKGDVIRGDQILLICANLMKKKGALKNNLVITTVMSNVGLKAALESLGIMHQTSDVGDRYVLERMLQSGAVLGGENSGHLIFLNDHTTGDGLFSALNLIMSIKSGSKRLSELGRLMKIFPQFLMNVTVKKKPDISAIPEIDSSIRCVESKLGEKGRVLVRYSGTQPVCRVMVEGPTHDETVRYCQHIAAIIQQHLG